eukprot:6194480-Pleurochrysis_carterae.AAC.4
MSSPLRKHDCVELVCRNILARFPTFSAKCFACSSNLARPLSACYWLRLPKEPRTCLRFVRPSLSRPFVTPSRLCFVFQVNSVCVPRAPGESIGGIMKLKHKDGRAMTVKCARPALRLGTYPRYLLAGPSRSTLWRCLPTTLIRNANSGYLPTPLARAACLPCCRAVLSTIRLTLCSRCAILHSSFPEFAEVKSSERPFSKLLSARLAAPKLFRPHTLTAQPLLLQTFPPLLPATVTTSNSQLLTLSV